jgi:cytochrome c peroxidase
MRRGLLIPLLLGACSAPPAPPAPGGLRAPELPPVPALTAEAGGAPTADQIALGTTLYYDVRLSGSGHTSCNSCHGMVTAYQDNLITPIPDRSYPSDRPALTRNTPSFYNLIYAPVFRWDGSHTDLVGVMAFPFSEANMNLGQTVAQAQAALRKRLTVDLPGYGPRFQKAYGVDLSTLDDAGVWRVAGRALAAFVRQVVSRDAPFDRWNAGDDSAMGASAQRGLLVFRGKGRCTACHSGPFFTDFGFHNLSTSPPGPDGTRADEGRYLVSGQEADRGAFLTPTLRSSYDTGPYFHDGSAGGLRSVLGHLASADVMRDPNHDPLFAQPLPLTDDDMGDLIDFLDALRGVPVNIPPPDAFP